MILIPTGTARFSKILLRLVASVVLGASMGTWTHAQGDEFFSTLFERDTLTGDWGGLRTALAARGVEIGLSNYGDVMGVASGGLKRRTVYSHLIEPTVALDLDKLLGWKQARIFYRGIGTYGNDPADATGSLNAPSNLASISTFKVFEGWLEQRFFDDVLAVLIGLYAADTEFDVKETAGVFMNGGFGTALDLSQSGLNGPCIFPTSCFGVRLRLQPTPEYYLQTAVLDGVAGDPNNPRGTRINLKSKDGVLILNEVGYQQGAEEGRFLRAAVGGWLYTTTFNDIRDSTEHPRRRGTYGIYGLVESELFREAGQRTQGLSGFLRAGMADQKVNQIQYYAGGGLAYTGLLPRRDEDVAGFGVSTGFNGQKFKRAQRLAGSPVDAYEMAFEWTYRVQLLPWMSVQLDTQYIKNPGTDRTVDNALVFGFRYKITF